MMIIVIITKQQYITIITIINEIDTHIYIPSFNIPA